MTSCCLKAVLGLVLGAVVGAASAAAPTPSFQYDLSTGTGASGVTVNGAIFITPPVPEIKSGTGFWDPFVRIQASGGNNPGSKTAGCPLRRSGQYCEQGYNTSDNPVQFDEKTDPNFTRDLKLSEIPIVEVLGKLYFEFLLDIAEPAAEGSQLKNLLSLDELQLFVGADQATDTAAGRYSSNFGDEGTLGSLTAEYTLDGGVQGDSHLKLDYNLVGKGNGRADMIALIPTSVLEGRTDITPDSSVYLFSRFGDRLRTETNSGMEAQGSFEEWAVRGTSNGSGGPPSGIPEPGTLALVGAAMLAGAFRYRRRALAQA